MKLFSNTKDEVKTIEKQPLGSLYLIDFENVKDSGLYGIETLFPEDQVVVFYGSQNKSISLDTHLSVLQFKGQMRNIQLEKSAKNYLDFQLVTYLGYLLGTGEYKSVTIISKDTGFDSVIDFWKKRDINIDRRPSIVLKEEKVATEATDSAVVSQTGSQTKTQTKPQTKRTTRSSAGRPKKATASNTQQPAKSKTGSTTEAARKKIRKAVADQKLAGSHYTAIYKAFETSKDKNSYDTFLRKNLGQEKGAAIYNVTKEIWVEYHSKEN